MFFNILLYPSFSSFHLFISSSVILSFFFGFLTFSFPFFSILFSFS
jgi:hypothetical protein